MVKKQDRQNYILHEVLMHNRILLNDVAKELNVSADTIRRDIQKLDEAKRLKKVHGGAISLGFHSSNSTTEIYAKEDKVLIARKAITLIQPKSVNLISGGTTNLELARQLPPKLMATFFTPSLPIALELLPYKQLEVIFIGGKLSRESQIAIGGGALNTLADIKVDNCFLGTGYLDFNEGLTEFDWDVVQIKKAMIKASKKVISLCISEKVNSKQRYKICETQKIDTLVTELEAHNPVLIEYKRKGLKIL